VAVRVRSQPHRVEGEWSGLQAQNLDEMFQILFDDLKLLATETIGAEGTGGVFQPHDVDLDALAALLSTGFIVRTGPGTAVTRNIVGGANIAVTNGSGVAGDASVAVTGIGSTIQPFDTDLSALAALSGTGFIVRTGSGTATTRSLTAGVGISISNGDGVAANPVITNTTAAGTSSAQVAEYVAGSVLGSIGTGFGVHDVDGKARGASGSGWSVYDSTGTVKMVVAASGPTLAQVVEEVEAFSISGTGFHVTDSTGSAKGASGSGWTVYDSTGTAKMVTVASGTSMAQVIAVDTYQVLSGGGAGWVVTDLNGALKTTAGGGVTLAQVAANVSLRAL